MAFSVRPCRRALLFFLFTLSLFLFIDMGLLLPFAQARGSPCPVPPSNEWTGNEKKVWNAVCTGESWTFAQPGKNSSGDTTIRKEFLEELLREPKYKKEITRGVFITGAQIKGPLDLSYATLSYPLQLSGCTFDENVSLRGLRTDSFVAFVGSTFLGDLNLSSIKVGDTLILTRGTFKTLQLNSAQIGDQVLMDGSTFNEAVKMNSMKTGKSVFLRRAIFKGDVDLRASDIGYNLCIQNSSLLGMLNLNAIRVRGYVFLGGKDEDNPSGQDNTTHFKKVDISMAEIQNNLEIVSSAIDDELILTGAHK